MEVMGWSRILRKRWWLALLLLLLTLAGTAALAVKPGPYTAESQVALLPSKHIAGQAGGNPYLSFGTADTLTADLLRRELTAPASVARLAAAGYSSTYLVTDDPTTAGPVLDITVTGTNKTMVEHTLSGVTAAASTTLASMQAGLDSNEQITSIVVSFDPKATLSVGKKARSLIVVLAVGVIVAIILPQAFDAAASRRRARRFGITSSSAVRSKAAPPYVTESGLPRPAVEPVEPVAKLDHSAERPVEPVAKPEQPAERPVEPAADRPGRLLEDPDSDTTIIFSRMATPVPAGRQDGILPRGEKAGAETTREGTEH